MEIVRKLAGYSMGRSDMVRRAMSKKKHKVMEEERKNFIYGIVDENEVYNYILEQMKDFEDCETKVNIIDKIKKAQKYKELTSAQDIFKKLLKNL